MSEYIEFLATKRPTIAPAGFFVDEDTLHPELFLFQNAIVRWALRLGRAAIFANVGLGKTFMQLEWARRVAKKTGDVVLILTPLAVAPQTVREGALFGIAVTPVDSGDELDWYLENLEGSVDGIYITNYERVHLFDFSKFGGVVLDESSILKHYSKKFFQLTDLCKDIPFRLCCTATPAPNDYVEFGNHALFLGIMHFKDMLARFFVGEGDIARSARLKGHARSAFWEWLTSWAVCISTPSDLGDEYHMDGYDLPAMHVHETTIAASETAIQRAWSEGKLLPDAAPSATSFMRVKRESLPDRIAAVKEIMQSIDDSEPVILWCDTDFEADALMAAFPDALEVRGSQPAKVKEERLTAFSDDRARLIITKPEIAGFGLNWQHCRHMIFAGISFSFERWYQAVGRIYRYGQTREVNIYMVSSETEESVAAILQAKRQAFAEMQAEMNAAMRLHGLFREGSVKTIYQPAKFDVAEGKDWRFWLGDCIEVMPTIPDDTVGLTVTSIPFSNLYIYSDADADVGNAADKAEFFEHMKFVIRELYRVTMPGRCCAVHVKDLPLFVNRDGVQGIDPFSDDTVAAFRAEGWVLQSRVTIEKDPVIEMQKTNSHGLLFKNWKQRAEILRVGLPDYVLIFQKRGDCPQPVVHDPRDLTYFGAKQIEAWRYPTLPSRKTGEVNESLPIWQRYANPNWSDVVVPLVWTDIDQTDVLNYLIAKDDKDERHLCPLQLDLIARVIQWKSNKGDIVFDPFGGVASTPYKALELGRRGWGVELKESYWNLGVKYLRAAEAEAARPTLFDLLEAPSK